MTAAAQRPLIECLELVKSYRPRSLAQRGRLFTAVDRVSLSVAGGETLALVGESGCGKTTTGRLLVRLAEVTSGRVVFDGTEITGLTEKELRPLRRRLQIIFQDPFSSLNPRFTIGRIVGEPLRIHEHLSGRRLEVRVVDLLERVGLDPAGARRYPHEFSGGQRQRIAIARAVAVNPAFVVADEPVSSLDISVQGQILKLLIELKRSIGMAMLFISHDLAVVRQISDRVAVMYRGRIVEQAATAEIFSNPLHPYTRLLLHSVLRPAPGGKDVRESPPLQETPAVPPSGARLRQAGPGHWVLAED
ncbi:MAG: ATP-binding cassette domain-containing protein [Candidatus Glassbacteria bacterium]